MALAALSSDALRSVKLRTVKPEEMRDRSSAVASASLGSDVSCEDESAARTYFFSTGVDEWYDPSLDAVTFRSVAVPLSVSEAREILGFYDSSVASHTGSMDASSKSPVEVLGIPDSLAPLTDRIDEAIKTHFPNSGVFVKLSTRSPKDAKLALRDAAEKYRKILLEGGTADGTYPPCGDDVSAPSRDPREVNRRLALLAEVQAAALKVHTGLEAMRLFLDSQRVAEDLQFALESPDFKWNITISVREWCPNVKLHSEWRGFVWNGKLNALGQYYHPIMFPCLLTEGFAQEVGRDCLTFFEKDVLPVISRAGLSNCVIDFAWLSEGKVVLVEINPFDGVSLGAFPVSTGLFLLEDAADKTILQNGPFEVRVRKNVLSVAGQKEKMSPDWRRIVFDA